MKKIIFSLFLLAGTAGAFAQTAAQQNLDDAITTANRIPQDVKTAQRAVNQLAKQLGYIGNPDAVLFHDKMYAQVNSIQNNADDIDYFTGLAQSASAIPFSTAEVNALTAQLVTENDELMEVTNQITTAIDNGDNNTALGLLPDVRDVLNSQKTTAAEIVTKLNAIKQAITTYKVCMRTVDVDGNPVNGSDLQGFYAQDNATGAYLYPDNQDGNCFEALAPGTYTFGSFNGYWSGTSSNTVTLSDALVNADGVIVVDLVYWSE